MCSTHSALVAIFFGFPYFLTFSNVLTGHNTITKWLHYFFNVATKNCCTVCPRSMLPIFYNKLHIYNGYNYFQTYSMLILFVFAASTSLYVQEVLSAVQKKIYVTKCLQTTEIYLIFAPFVPTVF